MNDHAPFVANPFARPWFAVAWTAFLFFVLLELWWMRDALLVCWVYGVGAYMHDGVRVLPGKPIRFSTGALAPQSPDLATGFAYFFAITLGLTLALLAALRAFARRRR